MNEVSVVHLEHAGISVIFDNAGDHLFQNIATVLDQNEAKMGTDELTWLLIQIICLNSDSPGINADYYLDDNVVHIDLNARRVAYQNSDGDAVSLPIESFIDAFLPGSAVL